VKTQSITLRADFDVEYVDGFGSDELMCKAARVSTLGADSINSSESEGLINFLTSNRHGSPFEHSALMFRISAPITVWREFMRHRIGFSYNEQSGRYMELEPVFYIPNETRNLVQVGKPGEYRFVPGSSEQYRIMSEETSAIAILAWHAYQRQLNAGIAKEVARLVLPPNIYSSAYVTCNPRSIMHFLSLRTMHEDALFPSFPMWEINNVADQMEAIFAAKFPLTHKAFGGSRRVAP
jgi:thymidylate synthase (FAD)